MPVWKLSCSGSCLELYKHQLFVGRDDDCDLTIKHKGIDIRHAVLNYDQRLGVFRLTDLGSSYGTFVNGESVCEESVPLYVGTRIMFGRNPMVWCVEVGEPVPKQLPSEPIQQISQQQLSHPMSSCSPADLSYSPEPRSGRMSYSFQTPAYRMDSPGSRAGKSYFGDPSPHERDSPYSRNNDSFVPTDRAQSSIGYSDSSFSDRIVTPLNTNRNPIESLTPDKGRGVNRQQTNTNTNTNTDSVSRGVPTRARALYGQPSWWGDGSDSFSTPPSHRKDKPDTPHPNKSVDPPDFSQPLSSPIYTHRHSYPDPVPSSVRDTAVATEYTPDRDSFLSQNIQTNSDSAQRDTGVNDKESETIPTLRRCGSYEIPLDQLDPYLSRPIIEPDPVFCTPYSGNRKSEVFTVEFGDRKSVNKKAGRVISAHSEPRVLFRDSIKYSTRKKDNPKSKVKLAFRETEPSFQTADALETGLDSCSDTELRFMTPKQCPPLVSPDITDSLLSDRGEIGDPVTSSTPISVTSSEEQSSASVPRLPNIGDRMEGLGESISSQEMPEGNHKKVGRRVAWQQEREKCADIIAVQSVSETARRLETGLESVFKRAMSLHGLLNRHFGDSLVPVPHFTPPRDLQTDTTNKDQINTDYAALHNLCILYALYMSLIIDCGAYSMKAGLSTAPAPLVIPNYIARAKLERHRTLVGSEILSHTDMGGLVMLLAFQKGYVVNWDIERQLFDHLLGPSHLSINPQETDLVFSEPPFNFPSIRDTLDEILFEEYGFKSVTRCTAANLSAYRYTQEHPFSPACLVIDSGFSFTHVMPFCGLKPVLNGFVRIDVGGKFLTNQLKDLISYRQINVTEETYVINQVKEDTCFVSRDLYGDMSKCKQEVIAFRDSGHVQKSGTFIRYILPDFSGTNRGYIYNPASTEACPLDRTLNLGNERFSVPELLFTPSDIGLDQMGLAETVQHSLTLTPPLMTESLARNIILTGGSTLFPGFRERLYHDLRAGVPSVHDLEVLLPTDPITYAWDGGRGLANSEVSTRPSHLSPLSFEAYMEQGHSAWNLKSHITFC